MIDIDNSERKMLQIIGDLCVELGYTYNLLSYGWIIRLTHHSKSAFIFGYNFPVNSATTAAICKDKSATSEILNQAKIPSVEHILFMKPSDAHYVGTDGNWQHLTDLLIRHKIIVLKDNEGTGGGAVFKVQNQHELEDVTDRVFRGHRTMAVSPFYEIKEEYRAVVLNGIVRILYQKQIPFIVGDGVHSIIALLAAEVESERISLLDTRVDAIASSQILQSGEKYQFGWKSNLGQGAIPIAVEDSAKENSINELALQAASALSATFVSVDIIEEFNGTLRVLEVNSGIMLEHFASQSSRNYEKAKAVYRDALRLMLEDNYGVQ